MYDPRNIDSSETELELDLGIFGWRSVTVGYTISQHGTATLTSLIAWPMIAGKARSVDLSLFLEMPGVRGRVEAALRGEDDGGDLGVVLGDLSETARQIEDLTIWKPL